MDSYKPLSNVISDPDANLARDCLKTAANHFEKSRTVFPEISRKDPARAEQIAAFVMQTVLGRSGAYGMMVKGTSLAVISLLLCSCAGFKLPPSEPTDNRPRRIPGQGDESLAGRAVLPRC
jgi:hypothetical protein